MSVVYWLLTENYFLNSNILVFMLMHTELFSNVSGLGVIHCGLGLEIFFGPRPRPHSFWPRPWPYAQLASLTSLVGCQEEHPVCKKLSDEVLLTCCGIVCLERGTDCLHTTTQLIPLPLTVFCFSKVPAHLSCVCPLLKIFRSDA